MALIRGWISPQEIRDFSISYHLKCQGAIHLEQKPTPASARRSWRFGPNPVRSKATWSHDLKLPKPEESMTHHHVQEAPIFWRWEMLRLLRAHGFPFQSQSQHGVALLRRFPVTWAWCVSVVVQMGTGPKWRLECEGLPVSLSTSQLRIFNYIYISINLCKSRCSILFPDTFIRNPMSIQISNSFTQQLLPIFRRSLPLASGLDHAEADTDTRIPVEIIPMDVPNSHGLMKKTGVNPPKK